jgi:gliding motility-associated-like protein
VERNTFLLVIDKGYDIMIPTGFTPNGDGTNDLYNAQHRGLKKLEMSIYDTWGSLIYSEQGETLRGWDGTLNGRPAENGNYVYKFTATTFYGHTLDFTAPFTLLK